MEFEIDCIIARLYKIWLANVDLGQDEIAKQIGLRPFSFRKFLKKETFPKLKTQMKILAWINKMEAA